MVVDFVGLLFGGLEGDVDFIVVGKNVVGEVEGVVLRMLVGDGFEVGEF